VIVQSGICQCYLQNKLEQLLPLHFHFYFYSTFHVHTYVNKGCKTSIFLLIMNQVVNYLLESIHVKVVFLIDLKSQLMCWGPLPQSKCKYKQIYNFLIHRKTLKFNNFHTVCRNAIKQSPGTLPNPGL